MMWKATKLLHADIPTPAGPRLQTWKSTFSKNLLGISNISSPVIHLSLKISEILSLEHRGHRYLCRPSPPNMEVDNYKKSGAIFKILSLGIVGPLKWSTVQDMKVWVHRCLCRLLSENMDVNSCRKSCTILIFTSLLGSRPRTALFFLYRSSTPKFSLLIPESL